MNIGETLQYNHYNMNHTPSTLIFETVLTYCLLLFHITDELGYQTVIFSSALQKTVHTHTLHSITHFTLHHIAWAMGLSRLGPLHLCFPIVQAESWSAFVVPAKSTGGIRWCRQFRLWPVCTVANPLGAGERIQSCRGRGGLTVKQSGHRLQKV